jgi:hypothetical protein
MLLLPSSPLWGPWPDFIFIFLLTITLLFFVYGALSNGRTGKMLDTTDAHLLYRVWQASFLFGKIGLYGKRTLLVTPPHDGYWATTSHNCRIPSLERDHAHLPGAPLRFRLLSSKKEVSLPHPVLWQLARRGPMLHTDWLDGRPLKDWHSGVKLLCWWFPQNHVNWTFTPFAECICTACK